MRKIKYYNFLLKITLICGAYYAIHHIGNTAPEIQYDFDRNALMQVAPPILGYKDPATFKPFPQQQPDYFLPPINPNPPYSYQGSEHPIGIAPAYVPPKPAEITLEQLTPEQLKKLEDEYSNKKLSAEKLEKEKNDITPKEDKGDKLKPMTEITPPQPITAVEKDKVSLNTDKTNNDKDIKKPLDNPDKAKPLKRQNDADVEPIWGEAKDNGAKPLNLIGDTPEDKAFGINNGKTKARKVSPSNTLQTKTPIEPTVAAPGAKPIPIPAIKATDTLQLQQSTSHKPITKTLYKLNPQQQKAREMDLPTFTIKKPIDWKRQMLPPNIAQRYYYENNTHLDPVIFQSDIDGVIFTKIYNKNDIETFRALLDKISNINIQDHNGNSLLAYALTYGNHDAMMLLLQRGVNPDYSNDQGYSPLHLACVIGDETAVILLLEQGANVNMADATGTTPIMYAAATGNSFIVKKLLSYGANLDVINDNYLSAYDFAFFSNQKEMAQYLTKVVAGCREIP